MRKALFLLNPIAGVNKLKITPDILDDYFRNSDIEVKSEYTQFKGHGSELIRHYIDKDYTDVIAVGGDGSLRDVARECIHREINVGVLPTGSGNGIARHLDIPVHSLKALEIIKNGESIPLDCGKWGEHYFFSNAGVGLDAWIIKKYDEIPQRGWMTYTRLGVEQYFKFKPSNVRARIGTESFEFSPAVCSIALSNQFGYNVKIAPEASLYDGLFDVQLIPMLNIPRALTFTTHMLLGKYYRAKDVILRKTESIHLEVEAGLPMQLDGEPFITEKSMEFIVEPRSWNMLVPQRVAEEYKKNHV